MPVVYAIANQKGGTGKTTTSVSLASGLAAAGYVTALIDTDAQGSCSVALGLRPEGGLYTLLTGRADWPDVLVSASSPEHRRPDLWLLPSDQTTARLKLAFAGEEDYYRALADELAPIECEFVVIDCAPGVDLVHRMAHFAADFVIVPTLADHLSLVGLQQEVATLAEIQERYGKRVELAGILPTFWDGPWERPITIESRLNRDALLEHYGPLVLTPPIPRTTRLRECPSYGRTVWEHIPGERAARAYAALVRRVLEVR